MCVDNVLLSCVTKMTPQSSLAPSSQINNLLAAVKKKWVFAYGVGFHTHTRQPKQPRQRGRLLTTESMMKLHPTISMLSTRLLMGLHWATSAVSCRRRMTTHDESWQSGWLVMHSVRTQSRRRDRQGKRRTYRTITERQITSLITFGNWQKDLWTVRGSNPRHWRYYHHALTNWANELSFVLFSLFSFF